MKEYTIDELRQALRTAAGEADAGSLDGDILDVEFADLGYDSLAVMETTSQVERKLDVKLPEEEAAEMRTPREFLGFVNARLSEAA